LSPSRRDRAREARGERDEPSDADPAAHEPIVGAPSLDRKKAFYRRPWGVVRALESRCTSTRMSRPDGADPTA
jgi:hypothetical protein